jgi:hypothetical protein
MPPIIDAHSGEQVVVGGTYDGFTVHDIRWGLLGLRCFVLVSSRRGLSPTWQELPVRLTHPSFFLQRVAFLPT